MATNKGNKGKAEKYAQPKKGTGKEKYQNAIKEARVNTKQAEKKERLAGKKLSKSEAQARTRKAPNLAKQIDREYKEQKGVRTAKPSTPKVPVKPRGGMGMRGGVGGSNRIFGSIK